MVAGEQVATSPGTAAAASDGSFQYDWLREGKYEAADYRFNRAGNLVFRRDEGGELILAWDADQRLVESRMNGAVARYRYDPLGRRTEKSTSDGRTVFVWDGDALLGEVFEEWNGASKEPSARMREWVYFPDTFEPLAMIVGGVDSGAVFHYHNDPNGSPIGLTDSRGNLRWAARYTASGLSSELNPNGLDNPLRLQGQYHDAETGLRYNRNRYYDPRVSQFASQDPLGVEEGERLYRLAPNVLGWVDPLGLNCRLTPGKGHKFHDAASQVRLRGRSLNSGTTALREAGLVRRPGRGGAYEFVDPRTGAIRAKWVPRTGREPAHWSKFEPTGNQAHYLNDAGRPVTATDRSHRIRSNGGSPIGGTGPGRPVPIMH
jgi:RHS repeat-associated protein